MHPCAQIHSAMQKFKKLNQITVQYKILDGILDFMKVIDWFSAHNPFSEN